MKINPKVKELTDIMLSEYPEINDERKVIKKYFREGMTILIIKQAIKRYKQLTG